MYKFLIPYSLCQFKSLLPDTNILFSTILKHSNLRNKIFVKTEEISGRKHCNFLGYYTLCLQDDPTWTQFSPTKYDRKFVCAESRNKRMTLNGVKQLTLERIEHFRYYHFMCIFSGFRCFHSLVFTVTDGQKYLFIQNFLLLQRSYLINSSKP